MLLSKSLVLATIKEKSSAKLSLSQQALDDLAVILEIHMMSLIKKTIILSVYRHKPKRVLPGDVQAVAEVLYPATIANEVVRNSKAIIHGKKVLVKSSAIKSKILEAIQTDPSMSLSYQKVPKATIQYLKGTLVTLVSTVIGRAINATRADGKSRIDTSHITTALTTNQDMFSVFPETAFQATNK